MKEEKSKTKNWDEELDKMLIAHGLKPIPYKNKTGSFVTIKVSKK